MESKQPFAGIRVVEFGQFVSVPFCAQLLAEGGAEVIKVEALAGDPTRLLRQVSPLETRMFASRTWQRVSPVLRCVRRMSDATAVAAPREHHAVLHNPLLAPYNAARHQHLPLAKEGSCDVSSGLTKGGNMRDLVRKVVRAILPEPALRLPTRDELLRDGEETARRVNQRHAEGSVLIGAGRYDMEGFALAPTEDEAEPPRAS